MDDEMREQFAAFLAQLDAGVDRILEQIDGLREQLRALNEQLAKARATPGDEPPAA